MATAKKLPSGNWNIKVYDYTDSTGKRHYASFTATSKKEAEYQAAEFALKKKNRSRPENMTVGEAIDKYICERKNLLSPTTVVSYKSLRNHHFENIINIPLGKVTQEQIQKEFNEWAKTPNRKGNLPSPKTLSNAHGLLSAVFKTYVPDLKLNTRLPAQKNHIKTLIPPEDIFKMVKGTNIELPVLLAMWLSFSLSEIRGLTKSKSIDGDYITIREVLVNAGGKQVRKDVGKAFYRIRRHKMPQYIKNMVENCGEVLVPLTGQAIYKNFISLQIKNGYIDTDGKAIMSFHDLRHLNASVMALLQIPDKYAMERGGWKTDKTMKTVYQHTFNEERIKVDAKIDKYFDDIMQHEMQHGNK